MKLKVSTIAIAICLFLATSACSKQAQPTYKDSVKTALEQADIKDVSVSEDADKNTITLGGTLHSDDA
jgi:ABC-type enterochelin transport system substrate-binding protein